MHKSSDLLPECLSRRDSCKCRYQCKHNVIAIKKFNELRQRLETFELRKRDKNYSIEFKTKQNITFATYPIKGWLAFVSTSTSSKMDMVQFDYQFRWVARTLIGKILRKFSLTICPFCFRLILIGDSTVGKSSLLKYFTDGRFAEVIECCLLSIFGVIDSVEFTLTKHHMLLYDELNRYGYGMTHESSFA